MGQRFKYNTWNYERNRTKHMENLQDTDIRSIFLDDTLKVVEKKQY